MEPVKLGIIGCGVIGSFHVNMAMQSPLVELVAVADLIEERARAAAEKSGAKQYASDVELLNDDEVEAVVLAMPVIDRTPVVFKSLAKGKHVIVEKPIAANVADVEQMIAARGDRVVSLCSSRITFTSHAEAAAKCVATGALGQIRIVRVRAIGGTGASPWGPPPPWRQSMRLNGGGILVNWSCYDLDYLMHITGWQLQPQTVLAQWWPVGEKMTDFVAPGSDADSHYVALVQCRDGIVLSMERAEFTSATNDAAWEIIGAQGTLHLPMVPQAGKANTVVLDRFVPGEGVVSETLPEEPHEEQGICFLENFVAAVREGKPVRTPLERALLMQKLTDAIYASARLGEGVAIR